MKLFVVGLSHQTAPISIRDKVAVSSEDMISLLTTLKENKTLRESMMLSTCNRTEIYGLIPKLCLHESSAVEIFKSLFITAEVPLDDYLYYYTSEEAVRHLFKVSAGLDSLAFGEPQIFGQVKEAYKKAADNKNTGPILNRLLHRAFTITMHN